MKSSWMLTDEKLFFKSTLFTVGRVISISRGNPERRKVKTIVNPGYQRLTVTLT
jgi:hypothetical protein